MPAALTAALSLALLELGSFGFFRLAGHRLPIASGRRFALAPGSLDEVAAGRIFDAELGWTAPYDTPFGERPGVHRGRPLLLAFGDSFVHGDEVGASQTWEEALAEAAGRDVLNFGVPAYGADQALLRFRRVAPRVEAPLALLGFPPANIGRVVSRYRRFYFRQSGVPLSKPRFVLREGRLDLLPNPVSSLAELGRLADPAFVERMGQDDLWFSRLPRPSFPYSAWIVRPSLWRAAAGIRGRDDAERKEADALWDDSETRELFLAILAAFVSEARDLGRQPVIALLPSRHSIETVRNGRDTPGRREVLEHCAREGFACFDGVSTLVEAGAARRPASYFRRGGHTSAMANALLGVRLHEFLKSKGLDDASRGAK